MKFLIWFGCILCYGIIQAIFKGKGILLGGIPTAILVLITLSSARSLCKLWEKHKEEKENPGKITSNYRLTECPQCGYIAVFEKRCPKCDYKFPTEAQTDEDLEIPKILFCRKCGTKLLENARFCKECGTEIIEKVEEKSDDLQ